MGFSGSKEPAFAMEQPSESTLEKPQGELSLLSDDELRSQLHQFGETVGPITSTTRKLLEKKLYFYLNGKKGDSESENKNHLDNNNELISQNNGVEGKSNKNVLETPLPTTFYGVSIPADLTCADPAEDRVFTETSDMVRYTKKTPGARFKVFSSYERALEFATIPCDSLKEPKKEDTGESSPFRGPRIQDLVKMRKGIETGNQLLIREIAWSNPRYLISSGDTPTILQEGFRYNAFHSASLKNQAPMCRYLLSILGDARFLKLLYPQDTDEMRNTRMQHILDLYLNMPDKGFGETPLHFACKFGHHEVVKVLASHPLTDKTKKNRDGLTAEQVICSRVNNASQELKDQIKDLLEAQCYVPLLRSVDNTMPATVGEPWSPENGVPVPSERGMLLMESPKDPGLVVKAFAGPMSPSQAKVFKKQWLTPPSPNPKDVQKYNHVRCGDSDKGLERLGRKLAKSLGLPWQEYWDFLGGFTDLSGEDGLDQLEHYLAEKYEAILSNNHLDDEIEQLEARLRAFHVTSPESPEGQGVLGAIYQEHYTQTPVTHNTTPLGASPMFKFKSTSKPFSPAKKEQHEPFIKKFDFGDPVLDPGNRNICQSSRVIVDSNQISVTGQGLDMNNAHCTKDENEDGDVTMTDIAAHRKHNDSISSMDSDCESFYTAQQSAAPTSIKDEDEDHSMDETDINAPDVDVFIFGEEPTKFDMDVFNAVNELKLSPEHYPNICKWKKKIMTHSEEDRSRWKSPCSKRTMSVCQVGRTPPPTSPLASPRFNRVRTNLTQAFTEH